MQKYAGFSFEILMGIVFLDVNLIQKSNKYSKSIRNWGLNKIPVTYSLYCIIPNFQN